MNINLDTLDLRELNSLLTAARKRKQLLDKRIPIATARKRVAAIATKAGYSIEEVLGTPIKGRSPGKKAAPRRKLGKVAPKYRDPENKRNTWSGRGRMPVWLAEKTKRGRSVADFLIPGLAKPTARTGGSVGKKSVVKKGE